MDRDEHNDLPSHAHHYWEKRVATTELTCWGSGATINVGDTYYEYITEVTLYGVALDMEHPVVTKREYFKHVLQGRPGFTYHDKKE